MAILSASSTAALYPLDRNRENIFQPFRGSISIVNELIRLGLVCMSKFTAKSLYILKFLHPFLRERRAQFGSHG
jgi:hypothetical protein